MTPWASSLKSGNFEDHKAVLEAIYRLAGGNPALDLGCGEAHVTKNWICDYADMVRRPTAPGKMIQMDIRDAPHRLRDMRYNLTVMTDVIEHLTTPDAEALLCGLWNITKAIAIFTPMGPFKMDETAKDPDAHKSGWFPKDFYYRGWEILAYPNYHHFEGGEKLGAFWAWKFLDLQTPYAEAVLTEARLAL